MLQIKYPSLYGNASKQKKVPVESARPRRHICYAQPSLKTFRAEEELWVSSGSGRGIFPLRISRNGIRFSLGTGLSLPLSLVSVKNGLHCEPEEEAHHNGRKQYGHVLHGLVAFRLQEREENGFADTGSGEEHHQAVNSQAEATHGRRTVFKGAEEVLVQLHGLVVAGGRAS